MEVNTSNDAQTNNELYFWVKTLLGKETTTISFLSFKNGEQLYGYKLCFPHIWGNIMECVRITVESDTIHFYYIDLRNLIGINSKKRLPELLIPIKEETKQMIHKYQEEENYE